MYGEQWICQCGTHNLIIRNKCRRCRASRTKAEISRESILEVIDRVSEIKSTGNDFSEDLNPN